MVRHQSVWIDTAPAERRPALQDDLHVDVAVVGAGIVGLVTASMLHEQGKDVAVLEAGRILEGVTGHTTAKVTSQHGPRYHDLVKRFGRDVARLHGETNEAAIDWVRGKGEDLEVPVTSAPAFVYSTDRAGAKMLDKEASVAGDLGLPASFVTETELPFSVEGAVRFEDQAHFHPRDFLLALVSRMEEQGVRVFEGTRVMDVADGTPCRVGTEGGTVTADAVVLATNVPINDKKYFMARLKPVRAYGIAVRGDPGLHGMYINADQPVRSIRRFDGKDGPMGIFVGENHPVGHGTHTEEHHRRLVDFARGRFGLDDVAYGWSTQDFYPFDGLPYIGRASPGRGNVWTATGMQGWGMTGGIVAARRINDAVAGHSEPWHRIYDPFWSRRVVKDLVRPRQIKSQVHVAKMFLGERFKDHEANGLRPGQGAIVDEDHGRLAVHRDGQGELHVRDARCTHMGCIVQWNHGEQSWDCPCHGSRFDPNGEVLHGPATRALEPAGEAAAKRLEDRAGTK